MAKKKQPKKSLLGSLRKIIGGPPSDAQHAKKLGKSAQAVGTACGHNPIPIIIPCHRVVGADGAMTGFSGGEGVETKVQLLQHEGMLLA